MKTKITAFFTLLMTLTLVSIFPSEVQAGSRDGKKGSTLGQPASYFLQKVESGSSEAKVIRTDVGTSDLTFRNPYSGQNFTTWAGTFYGTIDGEDVYFYCIDLSHQIAFYTPKRPHKYIDSEPTSNEITYVLNNYYPFISYPYTGAASTVDLEAAAVQMVMWHYADGVDINTMNDGDVKDRALEIQADADANAGTYIPLETLLLVPASQTVPIGIEGSFSVSTFDVSGNNLGGVSVELSATSGTLSETNITTTASGAYGPITISQGSQNTSTITAIADVVIPMGTMFVHKWSPGVYQKIALATPAGDQRRVTAEVNWYQQGNNGCNLNGYLTYTKGGWGSKSNSEPGQVRDQYFDEVFPSGLVVGTNFTLTLTSAQAVEDFLPSGGNHNALSQNYVDPTGTLESNLADQVVALTLNVKYDEAGKTGTNPTNLGDLEIIGGTFDGMLVSDFLDIANQALGGESVAYDLGDITDAASSINENFDNGTTDEGFLICQPDECFSSIGDFVWRDKNLDGKQDNDEAGIPNVLVNLIYDGQAIATSTTDNDGKYGFDDLENGNYTVEIDASNFDEGGTLYNHYATKQNNASDDKDSDGDKNTHRADVSIDCDDDYTIDFGYFLVCLEFEKTGPDTVKPGDDISYEFSVFNCGDVKLGGGVTVYDSLLNPVGNHQIWYKTVKPGESYTFTKTYTTTENDCGELVNAAKAIGHPANVNWSNAQTIIKYDTVTTIVDCDTAEICIGKIGDRVWLDFSSEGEENNCNGLQDAEENGIANVKVLLKNSEGTVVAFTYTGLDGYYIFEELCDETYTVEIDESTLPEDVVPTLVQVGNDESIDNNGSPYAVTLSEGNRINLTIDFGYCVEEQEEDEADLRINKEVSDSNPENGDQITYTITVTNDGPADAENVEVYDVLPAGLEFNSATASQGTYDENTGLWIVGTLAGGASATLGITVTVDVEVVNTTYFDLGPALAPHDGGESVLPAPSRPTAFRRTDPT